MGATWSLWAPRARGVHHSGTAKHASTLRRYSLQTITETRPSPSVHVRVTTVCRNRSRLGIASRNTGLQRVSHRLGTLKVRPPGPVRLDRGPSRLCRNAPRIATPPPRRKTAGSRTPATNLSALAASAVTARPVARRAVLAYVACRGWPHVRAPPQRVPASGEMSTTCTWVGRHSWRGASRAGASASPRGGGDRFQGSGRGAAQWKRCGGRWRPCTRWAVRSSASMRSTRRGEPPSTPTTCAPSRAWSQSSCTPRSPTAGCAPSTRPARRRFPASRPCSRSRTCPSTASPRRATPGAWSRRTKTSPTVACSTTACASTATTSPWWWRATTWRPTGPCATSSPTWSTRSCRL